MNERVERYVAFYELLPEASRDAELREHLMAYYQGWYAWAGEVLTPSARRRRDAPHGQSATLGQFASILLDGIFMQMVVAPPDFDLEAALKDARRRSGICSTRRPRAPADVAEALPGAAQGLPPHDRDT